MALLCYVLSAVLSGLSNDGNTTMTTTSRADNLRNNGGAFDYDKQLMEITSSSIDKYEHAEPEGILSSCDTTVLCRRFDRGFNISPYLVDVDLETKKGAFPTEGGTAVTRICGDAATATCFQGFPSFDSRFPSSEDFSEMYTLEKSVRDANSPSSFKMVADHEVLANLGALRVEDQHVAFPLRILSLTFGALSHTAQITGANDYTSRLDDYKKKGHTLKLNLELSVRRKVVRVGRGTRPTATGDTLKDPRGIDERATRGHAHLTYTSCRLLRTPRQSASHRDAGFVRRATRRHGGPDHDAGQVADAANTGSRDRLRRVAAVTGLDDAEEA